MPNDTPQTLPADFFSKKQATAAPQTLPPDFFSKKEAESATAKNTAVQGTISAQRPLLDRIKASVKSVAMDPFNLPRELGSMTSGIENYTQEGRAEHPILSRVGDITKGTKDFASLLATGVAATGGAGIGGPEALEAVGEATVGKLATKTEPLARINKLLGVGKAEVVPGKVPASLEEFAANPARGAMKAGLDESKLGKMDPLERNAAVMKAKDAAGKQLEQVLEQATQAGKKVDLYPTVDKVFDAIPDPKLAKQTENAFIQLLKDNGVTGPLDQVTPTQARAIQRGVESLKGEGMEEITAQLRRGISEATRKAVPESAAADQHYWDMANAAKGTQKLVKKFATTVPENKLRKFIIKAAIGGGAAGAGYEAAKHFSTPVP